MLYMLSIELELRDHKHRLDEKRGKYCSYTELKVNKLVL